MVHSFCILLYGLNEGGGLVSIKHSAKHTAMAASCLQMAELILGEESEERDGSEERDEGLGKK